MITNALGRLCQTGNDPSQKPKSKFPLVLVVVGTRPDAIKMAPVIRQLSALSTIRCEICVTAQHRDMMDSVLDMFNLVPSYDLDIMRDGNDLCDVASGVMLGLRDVIRATAPHLVLVHGDTTTCMAATLAAFFHQIPVAHIEAGLRTFDLGAPFPEEANRLVVARLATLHFAPTETALANLRREGVSTDSIWVTGNTVIDALHIVLARLPDYPALHWKMEFGGELYQRITADERRLILITGHRRESISDGLRDMCSAVRIMAQNHPDWDFVYPVHPNSAVKRVVEPLLAGLSNVALVAPLKYLSFVWLMSCCDLILTDSGGIQEEGPALGKPVLVMRRTTERPEAIDSGVALLVGTKPEAIIKGTEMVLGDTVAYARMTQRIALYGDGGAAQRIATTVADYLKKSS